MRIFVTGATGFIGRHVVRVLGRRGHELLLLVRDEGRLGDGLAGAALARFVHGDLSDIGGWKGELERFGAEAVLHLAWEGLPDYGKEMCERNLKYGRDLFLAAAEAGCECIVATGSCWEYKGRRGVLSEDSELELSGCFGRAKNSLRAFGEEIRREYGISFYWPRLFYVYGPGQRGTSLIPHIIDCFERGVRPAIKNWANRNDFVYVTDVATALAGLIEERPGHVVYNVGSGCSVSVGEVMAALGGMMSISPEIGEDTVSAGDDFWADIGRIEIGLGWRPGYSLAEGLKETVDCYVRGAV